MSQSWGFQDRRGMFQGGKEVHEPSKRRVSGSTGGSVTEAVRKASISSNDGPVFQKIASNTSNTSSTAGETPRRKSSAGMFGNLVAHKRGSEDYGERRASHAEHENEGMVSGWFNKTFRGVQAPGSAQPGQTGSMGSQQERRGVME